MTRRKSRRRFNPWRRFSKAYQHRHALHHYEESVVLALLVERGPSTVGAWLDLEPGRWDKRLLAKVFRRLTHKRHAKVRMRRGLFGYGHYEITELGRKRLEVESYERGPVRTH